MARELTTLPKTQFSGLEYTNIIQDITNLIADNPNYNEEWEGFLSSDAGRMLVEVFAYITDQLATRIDWVTNENFLSTATQKRSVMRLLKLIGYNFSLPIASQVVITTTTSTSTYPGPYYLTEVYDALIGTFTPFSISAEDTTGATTTFELIDYDSTNDKYEYKLGVKVENTIENLSFYEGTTYVENFTATTNNGPTFTLANNSIIENSVRVYFVDNGTETELLEVNSFLDPEAQSEEADDGTDYEIPYILEVNEDETVTIEFGTTALLPNSNRRLSTGNVIKVFYRSGGGTKGNITTQTINTSRNLTVEVVGAGDTIVNVSFLNETDGSGGAAGETAAHAATYAPLQLRTVEKAVSAEDYDILLNANSSILTAKAYGYSNEPDGVFDNYGVYLNPFDVWIYALPDTSGWENLVESDYNAFQWIGLRLENMFNNIHAFRNGAFNSSASYSYTDLQGTSSTGDTIDWDGSGDTQFYNYFIIDTPALFKAELFGDSNKRIKITSTQDATSQFETLSNVVVGELYIGDSLGDTVMQLKGDTAASFTSYVNIETGVNMAVKKWIKINIDGRGDTVIDVSTEAINSSNVKAHEIAAAINKHLFYDSNYGDSTGDTYGDSTGVNGVASVIEPTTAESYIKLTSPYTGDSSFVYFKDNSAMGDGDVTQYIFGSHVTGDTYTNYGSRRITLITNGAETHYKKIIYENGSINPPSSSQSYYVHYLTSIGDTINLGKYFNETYTQNIDPEWRPVARRIYNTTNVTGDSYPDMDDSNFEMRFTSAATTSMSIYNITNSWRAEKSRNPFVMSSNPIAGEGDTIITNLGGDTGTGDSHYLLKINIDGIGDTTIDVTGDSGGDSIYTFTEVVANINSGLRVAYGAYATPSKPYNTFNYATKGDTYPTRLVITSPTADNSSSISIHPYPMGDSIHDASAELLLTNEGDTYYYYTKGDYYLRYNGDSGGDSATDYMQLIRVNNSQVTSVMPDGDFYVHFVWDRRNETGLGEDTYQTYLENSKIIGVNNVFKETKFGTFYIVGNVYHNKIYSSTVIKSSLESTLTEELNM
ncbi:MAG: hypothetical protein B6229_08205 [Spirochaetaceae bacterium 4572_7]|nr:MAG: hypothetical protein B6229_08205 [Spirochaetaceae bacterium 4572_7]